MNRHLKRIFALLLLTLALGMPAGAQDITPVDVDTHKPEQPRLHYYDRHGNKLDEPVLFIAETDTVKKAPIGSPWPVYNGVTAGVNIWDAFMLIAGQSYASFGVSGAVSIRNWVFPTVELGIGYANNHAEDTAVVYRTKPSPYLKIGADYNFLYKSTPDYQACIGVRFGMSPVSYEIKNGEIESGYWQESTDFSILNQHSFSCYGEALASVKVKIWRELSMGWSIRYHFNIKTTDGSNSTPWFIPGYGGSSPVTATFSLFYEFGKKEKKKPESPNQPNS